MYKAGLGSVLSLRRSPSADVAGGGFGCERIDKTSSRAARINAAVRALGRITSSKEIRARSYIGFWRFI